MCTNDLKIEYFLYELLWNKYSNNYLNNFKLFQYILYRVYWH